MLCIFGLDIASCSCVCATVILCVCENMFGSATGMISTLASKSVLIAETTAEYLEEEKKVLNQIDNDPLLRLKADEVQIRAREEQRKRDADEERSEIDRLRLIQNKDIAEQKIDENDKHQKLRAAVSLAKAGVKDMKAAVVEEE